MPKIPKGPEGPAEGRFLDGWLDSEELPGQTDASRHVCLQRDVKTEAPSVGKPPGFSCFPRRTDSEVLGRRPLQGRGHQEGLCTKCWAQG